jgi:thioredoxin-dependent peroxiredoxin
VTLAEGAKAPGFTLESSDGPVALKDFAGKTVVVYFYPKDLTPGCTTEAIDFHKAKDKFAKKGVTVLGISRDTVAMHEKFAEKCDLGFPLLSDPDGKVTKAWGAWGEKTMYGKKTEGVIRSTFIVGPDGKIKKAWKSVKVPGHVDAVLEALG